MHPGQVSWNAGKNESKCYLGIVCQFLVGCSWVMLGSSGTWASVVSTAHLAALQPCPVGRHIKIQNAVTIGHIFDIGYFAICVSVSHHVGTSIGMFVLVYG